MSGFQVHNKDDWERMLGRCVLAFNDIEYLTILLFSNLDECRFPEAARNLDMKHRLSILLEVLDRNPDIRAKAVSGDLKSARQIISKRNLIAHSPMFVDMAVSAQGVHISGKLVGARNANQVMKYEDIEALADQVRQVAGRLTGSTWSLINDRRLQSADEERD